MALVYSLAFNIVFLIQELFLAWGKNWLGLKSYLYHNNHDWEGSHELTPLLQGSGGLSILIFGVVMMLFYQVVIKKWENPTVKVLVLWLGLQGFLQFFPQLMTAFVAPQTDVGQAFGYLKIDGLIGFGFALTATTLMALAIKWYVTQFAQVGIIDTSSKKAQMLTTLSKLLIPILIGCVLIIPYRIMPWERGFMQFGSLVIWLPWLLLFSYQNMGATKLVKLKSGFWFCLIGAIVLLLFFQLVLAPGVKFG